LQKLRHAFAKRLRTLRPERDNIFTTRPRPDPKNP
jgi:hypothetical protein